MPSRVRILMRSASNSAKVAAMLKNIRPIGSEGSWTVVPRASVTPFRSSSLAMSRASGTERARRSSFDTTSVLSEARPAPRRGRACPVRFRSARGPCRSGPRPRQPEQGFHLRLEVLGVCRAASVSDPDCHGRTVRKGPPHRNIHRTGLLRHVPALFRGAGVSA